MPDDAPLPELIGERVRAGRRPAGWWTLDQPAEVATVGRRLLIDLEQGATDDLRSRSPVPDLPARPSVRVARRRLGAP